MLFAVCYIIVYAMQGQVRNIVGLLIIYQVTISYCFSIIDKEHLIYNQVPPQNCIFSSKRKKYTVIPAILGLQTTNQHIFGLA